MKKIFSFILLAIFIFLFAFKINVFACSLPPNILSRFYIFEEKGDLKIKYSLYTWEDFKNQIENDFKKQTGKNLDEKTIDIFVEKYVKDISEISYNGKKLDLELEKFTFNKAFPDENNIFLDLTFKTGEKGFQQKNNFYLKYKKDLFLDKTSLVHAYLYSSIEDGLETDGFVQVGEERFQKYVFEGYEYAVFSEIIEEKEELVEYKLDFNKIGKAKSEIKENIEEKQEKQEKNLLYQNGFSKYFENFLKKETSIFEKTFFLIFAVIFGALHGLLPGHSKSIVGAYMLENSEKKSRKMQMFILILSITLSHTFFIFLIALILYFLSTGVGTGSYYVKIFSSILYIIFGIYFIYYSLKKIFLEKKHKHHHCCSCCSHKKEEKTGFAKTITLGIIFGCNPCVDALVLFLLSFSIGNIFYAVLIVLAFSLGLGLMLGFLSYLTGKGYKFLSNKNSKKIQNILNFIVLALGFIIIFVGISGLFLKF